MDPDGHECTIDGEKHGALWCFGHALGLAETKKEYNDRMEWALKHPISPAQAEALQQENTAVSIIMIGMAGGENSQLDSEIEIGASSIASGGWVTVGRWMSKEELEAMKSTGMAQRAHNLEAQEFHSLRTHAEGRLAASKGQPVPQMPRVRNIVVKGQK